MELVECENIFSIEYGGNFTKVSDYSPGETPVIKSQATNNGVIGFFDIEPNYTGVISVARTGSIGASFLHDYPCYITDDCMVLRPKAKMSKKAMLVYASIIQKNSKKYNYSRKITPTRLGSDTVPTLDAIQQYLPKLAIPQQPSQKPASNHSVDLRTRDWQWFKLQDIFTVKKGKRLTKYDMNSGETPFVGAIASNNGVRQYISSPPIFKENTITVNYNGSVGEAFFQTTPYWASDDVNVLYPRFSINPYTAMFLTTLIQQEKYRFCYGRKWHKERMEKSEIMMPVDKKGNPDWLFMENFIKSLPYSSEL